MAEGNDTKRGYENVKSEHGNVVNNVLSNVNKFYTLKELPRQNTSVFRVLKPYFLFPPL